MVGNCEMDCCSAYLFTLYNNPFLKKKKFLLSSCTHRVDTVLGLIFPEKYSSTIKHPFAKRRCGWLLKEFLFYVQIQVPSRFILPIHWTSSVVKLCLLTNKKDYWQLEFVKKYAIP